MPRMDLTEFLLLYVFPMQLAIGLIGNIFNLIVLLSKGMRSKTNTVLAIMALADILFLLFMVPHSLIVNERLAIMREFKRFIVIMHPHFNGVVNMCSFASAWLIVMVSMERMTAVIWPLRTRSFWTSRMLSIMVIGIWISAFTLSMHYHVSYEAVTGVKQTKIFNETTGREEVMQRPVLRVQIKSSMEQIWKIGVLAQMVTIVLLPVILVISSNVLMIITLRQRNREHDVRIKRQRRATIIVFIIASTFTICQTPSAVIYLVELIWPHLRVQIFETRTIATLTNSLVITGKTANFFLFCTWSSYFRKNFKRVIASKMPCCYNTLEQSIVRVKSNSTLRNSKNRIIGQFRVHRLQSQPTPTHYCPEGHLRLNHSFPLSGHIRIPGKEDDAEEHAVFLEDLQTPSTVL